MLGRYVKRGYYQMRFIHLCADKDECFQTVMLPKTEYTIERLGKVRDFAFLVSIMRKHVYGVSCSSNG